MKERINRRLILMIREEKEMRKSEKMQQYHRKNQRGGIKEEARILGVCETDAARVSGH